MASKGAQNENKMCHDEKVFPENRSHSDFFKMGENSQKEPKIAENGQFVNGHGEGQCKVRSIFAHVLCGQV